MKEIKSVRVRRISASSDENLSGIGDYKVTLYDNSDGKFKVGVSQSGRGDLFAEYNREGKFQNYTNDDFIKDGINILIVKQNNNNPHDIIQDPWLNNPPKWRSFGFDPYYLNNGSVVYITWSEETTSIGGRSWSDDDGFELDIQRGLTQSNKSSIVKNIKVISESENIEIDKNGIISKYTLNGKDYIGTIKDKDIINELINIWKSKVPNYDLKICDPNYVKCELIDYISPIKVLDSPTESEKTNSTESDQRIEMKVVLPENLELRVKQDIPSLKIYFGDIRNDDSGFTFGDFGDDLSLLDDEFTEAEFSGLEETSVFESQEYESESDRIQAEQQSATLDSIPYVPSGRHKLDILPGVYKGNPVNGRPIEIRLCQVHGKPINVKIADPLLDMIEAAKKEGVNIKVTSGFRPAYLPNLKAKSESGVSISAQSQEELYNQNCKNGKCKPDTAKAGRSKHGNGIAVDFNTGSRGKSFNPLNTKVYVWLVKNSWKYGFVRTVSSEEWHYEYYPDIAKSNGPYAKLPKNNQLFYADLGLNNLRIT
jgi:hypothetical protein